MIITVDLSFGYRASKREYEKKRKAWNEMFFYTNVIISNETIKHENIINLIIEY